MRNKVVAVLLLALLCFGVTQTQLCAGKRGRKRKRKRATRTAPKRGRLRQAQSYLNGKDRNRDGRISRGELGLKRELFDRGDKNKDGFLALSELLALPGFSARNPSARMDGKGNDATALPLTDAELFAKPVPACLGKSDVASPIQQGPGMIKINKWDHDSPTMGKVEFEQEFGQSMDKWIR